MTDRSFVVLEDAGDSRERGESDCRSSCIPQGDIDFLNSFKKAKRIGCLEARPVVEIEPPFPLEDMPWSFIVPIVSQRFKEFLETEAPGHAEFFEVELVGPKPFDPDSLKHMLPKGRRRFKAMFPNGFDPEALRPRQPYYVVNWLHALDCIDRERSIRDSAPDDPDITFEVIEIDPRRVPEDVLIFRPVLFMVTTYIDTRLAKKILDAGFTGPQFYPIGYDYPEDWPWQA